MDRWDVQQVSSWLISLGLGAYEKNFRENNITGDLLLRADHDLLKELEISAVGQRIAILKAIYNLKKQQNISFEPGDYIPETVAHSPVTHEEQGIPYAKLESMVLEQEAIIMNLSNQVEYLTHELANLKEELKLVLPHDKKKDRKKPLSPTVTQTNSFMNISIPRTTTKASANSPVKKPSKNDDYQSPTIASPSSMTSSSKTPRTPDGDIGKIRVYGNRLPDREKESYKTFLVNINDDCVKLIPEILNKYKIKDEYRSYALILCCKGQELVLSYDQKPLEIAQKNVPPEEMPEFIIRHLKQPSVQPSRGDRTSSIPVDTNVSQSVAVAIYEYNPQRDDELKVVIGDQFVIIDREVGWFLVEKDGRRGWVPAGCLLENMASEIQPSLQMGVALADYEKNTPNELDIKKGQSVVIYQHYQHWLLVERDGSQGWVPACYVSIQSQQESKDDPQPQNQLDLLKRKQSVPHSMQIRRPLTVRHSRSISDASNFSRKSNEEPGGNIRNQTLSKLNMLLESMATFDQDSLTTFHGNASLKKKVAELGRFISQCELKTTSADPPLYSEHLKNCREMINFLDNKMDQRTSFIPSETVIAQMALLMDSILKDIAGVREESRSASTAESCVIKADNVLSNIIQLLLEDARVASRKQGMDPDKSITKAEGTTSLVDTDRLTEMQRELQAKMRSALERKNVVVDDKPDTRVYEELPYDVVIQKKGLDVNNLEKYLSNEDCLKYLGVSKDELSQLPSWKLSHLKRKSKLT